MEEYDFSITETDIAREVKNNKKIILMDMEIIDYLRSEIISDAGTSNSKLCRVIFIETDGITHIIGTDSDNFSHYHVLIASAYSLMHDKCSLKICGGGYLVLRNGEDIEKFCIEGKSGNFNKMNLLEIKKLFMRLFVDVEIDESGLSEYTKFHEYSYDQILHISRHL